MNGEWGFFGFWGDCKPLSQFIRVLVISLDYTSSGLSKVNFITTQRQDYAHQMNELAMIGSYYWKKRTLPLHLSTKVRVLKKMLLSC